MTQLHGTTVFGPVPAVVSIEQGEEKEVRGVKCLHFQKEMVGIRVEIFIFGEIATRKVSALVEVRTRREGGEEVILVIATIVNLGGNPLYRLYVGPPNPKIDCRMPRLELCRDGQEVQIGFE